jgi:hypothetical protein
LTYFIGNIGVIPAPALTPALTSSHTETPNPNVLSQTPSSIKTSNLNTPSQTPGSIKISNPNTSIQTSSSTGFLSQTPSSLSKKVTELTPSASQYTSGQIILLTAKVSSMSYGAEKPSGTVTFVDGNTQIGPETVNSGKAILTTSPLSVGPH